MFPACGIEESGTRSFFHFLYRDFFAVPLHRRWARKSPGVPDATWETEFYGGPVRNGGGGTPAFRAPLTVQQSRDVAAYVTQRGAR
jgi:hypothetical protein